jgi:hypothetical protein
MLGVLDEQGYPVREMGILEVTRPAAGLGLAACANSTPVMITLAGTI